MKGSFYFTYNVLTKSSSLGFSLRYVVSCNLVGYGMMGAESNISKEDAELRLIEKIRELPSPKEVIIEFRYG